MINHCLYYSLNMYLEERFSIKLLPAFIYHLLGGDTFSYKKLENDKIPTFLVKGNKINYQTFSLHTDILVERITEVDYDKALQNTHNIIKNFPQLVITNCYYLPFDEVNYMKNYDNHMLIINCYNSASDSFIVSDANYKDVSLTTTTLMNARKNIIQKRFQYLDFEVSDGFYNKDISSIIVKIIRRNCNNFIKNGKFQFEKLKSEIENIMELDTIFKKVALNNLSRAIRHSHGPISSRMLMDESCKNLFLKNYEGEFKKISELWKVFADKLIRLQLDKIKVDEVTNFLLYIAKEEIKANLIILRLVKKQI